MGLWCVQKVWIGVVNLGFAEIITSELSIAPSLLLPTGDAVGDCYRYVVLADEPDEVVVRLEVLLLDSIDRCDVQVRLAA